MSGPKLRGLIVGMGGVSGAMLRVLQQQPWYETAAVVDISAEVLSRAQAALSLPDAALFQDLEAAFSAVTADVALINTPSELHYAQTKAALEAGLHVLVAKPITNNYEQAVELVELAEASRRKLCVGQQIRYFRHYQAVKQFIASGQLGRVGQIFFLNAKPRHKALNLSGMDQPALYEMSCHHFDSLMALMPELVPKTIVCDGYQPSWSVYSGPCMVNALIRFSGGLHILYHGGFSSQSNCYELRLEGTKGALRCRGIHMSNNTMTYEFAPRGGDFSLSDLDRDFPVVNPWQPFFDRWYAYLQGGQEPPFSGRNNLKVFALLAAAIDSIHAEGYIQVAGNPRYASAFAGV